MSTELTPVERAAYEPMAAQWGDPMDPHADLPSEIEPIARAAVAAARPLIEREQREQIAAEIEADTIPAELLDRDHDDQLTALRNWNAFIARGTCKDCDGTGVAYGEPCSTCAGNGTWGGASDAQ